MTKSQRLAPVERVAQKREQDAARVLGKCRQVLGEVEARLQELIAYRDEYARRLASGSGMAARHMLEYRSFLGRLGQAIGYQEQQVGAHRREFERQQERWRGAHTRTRVLEKVVERYQRAERADDDRREQQAGDELVQHRFRPPSDSD